MKEIGFHKNLLEKAYFIVKMIGPAIIGLASSYFWKVPLTSVIIHNCAVIEQKQIITNPAQSWITLLPFEQTSHMFYVYLIHSRAGLHSKM